MRLALADNGRGLFQRENLNRTLPSVRASEKTAGRSGVLLEFRSCSGSCQTRADCVGYRCVLSITAELALRCSSRRFTDNPQCVFHVPAQTHSESAISRVADAYAPCPRSSRWQPCGPCSEPRLRIPNSRCLIVGCRHDPPPIGTEDGRYHRPAMAFQNCYAIARLRVPQSRCSVVGRRHEPSPIRAERNRHNPTGMTLQECGTCARPRIPNACGPIQRRRGDPKPIWTTDNHNDLFGMADKQGLFRGGPRIPHAHRLVRRRRDDPLTSRVESS
jgi:hypothetical protein